MKPVDARSVHAESSGPDHEIATQLARSLGSLRSEHGEAVLEFLPGDDGAIALLLEDELKEGELEEKEAGWLGRTFFPEFESLPSLADVRARLSR